MIALLGIDCSTDPRKTGLALGELRGDVVHISQCATGSKDKLPAKIACEWLRGRDEVLIALDAPLGWPRSLGACLANHRAGSLIQADDTNDLFRRATDKAINDRLKKRPLEVGANLIARTAVAALKLLDEIRHSTGRPIPLAWAPEEKESWRAIEVYPAATRIGHRAPDKGGSLDGLKKLLDCSSVPPELMKSEHAVDAAVCALAAGDFLRTPTDEILKIAPPDHQRETAKIEGWIWAPWKIKEQKVGRSGS